MLLEIRLLSVLFLKSIIKIIIVIIHASFIRLLSKKKTKKNAILIRKLLIILAINSNKFIYIYSELLLRYVQIHAHMGNI